MFTTIHSQNKSLRNQPSLLFQSMFKESDKNRIDASQKSGIIPKNSSSDQLTSNSEFNKQFKGIDLDIIDMGNISRPRTAPLTPDLIKMIDIGSTK